MDPEALLEGLDDAQRAAVTSTAMPLVVLAPAGSGKTRVLTRRIAHRVATGAADPRHVLALTFTRKAAGELDDRLRRLGLRGDATTGTFHAVAWGTLRTRWADQGRPAADAARPQGSGAARAGADGAGQGQAHGGRRAGHRDRVGQGPHGHARRLRRRRSPRPAASPPSGRTWWPRPTPPTSTASAAAGLVDFDDLLALVARALEEDETFAAAQRWRFRHLFVDELQDVNPLQFRLLAGVARRPLRRHRGRRPAAGHLRVERRRRRLPPRHPPLVAAGRGGRAHAQLPLHARDPRRRPPRCSAAAGSRPRDVQATRAAGAPPLVRGHPDDRAEAIAIARAIRLARAPGRPWSEQAVLVRTHAQTHLIAEALREAGHPPPRPRRGRVPRPSRGPAGPPRRCATPTCRSAPRWPTSRSSSRPQAARELVDLGDDDEARAALLDRAGRGAGGRSPPWCAWATTTCGSTPTVGPTRWRPGSPPPCSPRATPAGPSRDAVDVATFHAAKGLEWATVHLAGVEDGFVPIAHARTAAAKAEEVRLLYVAMTRAQRELRITYAEQRTFNGRVGAAPAVAAPRPAHRPRRPPSTAAAGRRAPDDAAGRAGPTSSPASARRSRADRPPRPAGARGAAGLARRRPPGPPASSRRRCCPTTCWPASRPSTPARRRGARRHPRRRADPRPALRRARSSARSPSVTWREVHDRAAVRAPTSTRWPAPTPIPALYAAFVGLAEAVAARRCVAPRGRRRRRAASRCGTGFGGELSPAARAVIDPARLTWVERSTHDLAERRTRVHDGARPLPRPVPVRRARTASSRTTTASCRRHGEADLTVKALLVAGAVEGAIVSGLRSTWWTRSRWSRRSSRRRLVRPRRRPRGRPGGGRARP